MIGTSDFEIVHGDALDVVAGLPDGSVQLVLTSPPYNIGKEYERNGFRSLEEYSEWMRALVSRMAQKISPSGSICWQVGNHIKSGAIIPLDYLFFPIFAEAGFKLRNRIVWTFNFGLNAKQRLSGRYEVMLWFTKSDDYIFNLDSVRVPQLYPGKRHSSKKIGKSGPSGNPLGKNPSDFWTFDGERFFQSEAVWEIPNVKSNHPEKTAHPCQFPSELAERCILAFTNAGDLVLDPFAGTGTTPIVAHALQRRGLGVELSAAYADLARERRRMFEAGDLSMRPSGVAVRKPKVSERVSQIPIEWVQEAAE